MTQRGAGNEEAFDYAAIADGSVVCQPETPHTRPEVIAPHELWKVLRRDFWGNEELLGAEATQGEPRLIYYRFSNSYDHYLHENKENTALAKQKGMPPLRDLSQSAEFQAEVRKVMDELEHIAHVQFVPATAGQDPLHLAIGHANRWNQRSEQTTQGHKRYSDTPGLILMSVVHSGVGRVHTVRHELGHALGLNHPRNYPTQEFATRCDMGPENDLRTLTVMSYLNTYGDYSENDVKALQSLYGPSQRMVPYVSPPVGQRISIATAKTAEVGYDEQGRMMVGLDGREPIIIPRLTTNMLEVDSSEKDEQLHLVNPPRRVRFFYKGGHDTIRMQGKGRTLGIAGDSNNGVHLDIDMPSGNMFIYAPNNADSAEGDITIRLKGPAPATSEIEAEETEVISGASGQKSPAKSFRWRHNGENGWIAVPRGIRLHVEDEQGQPVVLPELPTAVKPPPQR